MAMSTEDKVFLISLGCAKNLVDSEHMLGLIKAGGFDLAPAIEEAGIVVINTCGFIENAVEETIDTILETAELRKSGRVKTLVVVGCFVQRYGYKLKTEMPEVDAWLGTGEIHRIVETLKNRDETGSATFHMGRPTYLADHAIPRIRTTPFFSAYLRIAEGCSHGCTYCFIPRLRGPFRSRNLESLVEEAGDLAAEGVKELNLIAQDTTGYGRDLGDGVSLEKLLEGLVHIEGLKWIRLLYCHPNNISDELLEIIDTHNIICPYLDLPLQHVNIRILEAMGRNPENESPWKLIERIRSMRRRISIRTTLMVGFPGETEGMFDELCRFVEQVRFDRLGTFIYSPEKGTPAARLEARIEPGVARKRLERIMGLQSGISKEMNREMVGEIVPVLVEGVSSETDLLLKGRISTMAPDADGQVLINKGEGVAGEIMPVRILEAHTYDLIGEIV